MSNQPTVTQLKPNSQVTKYHWILSLQWPQGGGFGTSTHSGTYGATPGTSRQDAYLVVYRDCCKESGVGSATVIFWSMEREAL